MNQIVKENTLCYMSKTLKLCERLFLAIYTYLGLFLFNFNERRIVVFLITQIYNL